MGAEVSLIRQCGGFLPTTRHVRTRTEQREPEHTVSLPSRNSVPAPAIDACMGAWHKVLGVHQETELLSVQFGWGIHALVEGLPQPFLALQGVAWPGLVRCAPAPARPRRRCRLQLRSAPPPPPHRSAGSSRRRHRRWLIASGEWAKVGGELYNQSQRVAAGQELLSGTSPPPKLFGCALASLCRERWPKRAPLLGSAGSSRS